MSKYEPLKIKGKCQNCKENGCYLQMIIIKGKKKYWCDTCIDGYKEDQLCAERFKNGCKINYAKK